MVKSRSYIATPPGATIKEQLNDRGMSKKEFAARMDMCEKHINRFINGEVQLTPEIAVRWRMRSMILESIGRRIRELRNSQGYSQEKLALKAEIDRTYLAGVEMGKRNLSIKSLEKILNALDIGFSEFFKEL